MNNSYLLSIVIPTRNRQDVLKKSLKQILGLVRKDEVQVVIQDNSDSDVLRTSISALGCSNIKYNYEQQRLSFVDNFNLATMLADGRYLCMIGDDDGICEELADVVKWAEKHNIDAVIPNVDFEYFWPNSVRLYNMEPNGIVRILESKPSIKRINSEKGVVDVLKNGCQNYMKYEVVKLYHGIVKRECLEKVRETGGKYFGGVSPDIYISMALSLVCENSVRITAPVTIAGVCKSSGSADSSNGKHVGRYCDMPHLNGHTEYPWSDLVPKFYSVETVWADSAIKAVEDMKRTDLLKYYNFPAFDAVCKLNYGDYSKWLDAANKAVPMSSKSLAIVKEKVKYYCRKVRWRISRIGKTLIVKNDLEDLSAAYKYYKETYCYDVKKVLR